MKRVEISFNTSKKSVKSEYTDDTENNHDDANVQIYNTPKVNKIININKKPILIDTNKLIPKSPQINSNNYINPNPAHNLNDLKSLIEDKNSYINDLNIQINNEISKIVICKQCKRKFANKAHYLRHTNLSDLHNNIIPN